MLAAAKYYELHLSPLSKVARLSQRTTRYEALYWLIIALVKAFLLIHSILYQNKWLGAVCITVYLYTYLRISTNVVFCL